MCITVMLVEDDKSVREAYCYVLSDQPDLRVVAEVGDGKAAVKEAMSRRPDVVLMDIGLPEMDGIEATRRIHNVLPEIRIVGLSVCDDAATFNEMTKAGAWGFLRKDVSLDELVTAVHNAAHGEKPVSRRFGGKITMANLPATSETDEPAHKRLTTREREVLQSIAKFCSTKEIAKELGISPGTVATHRKHLMEKLGIHASVALIQYAIKEGLIKQE